jgi:hypothetical protein
LLSDYVLRIVIDFLPLKIEYGKPDTKYLSWIVICRCTTPVVVALAPTNITLIFKNHITWNENFAFLMETEKCSVIK